MKPIVFGKIGKLNVFPRPGVTPRVWHSSKVSRLSFGTYGTIGWKHGRVEETRSLGDNVRIVARVLPEDVVAAIGEIDARIAEQQAVLARLRAEYQETLEAALPRCPLVREGDVGEEKES